MDLYAVMSEIDARLKTITGLRVAEFGLAGGGVSPPAAVQYLPEKLAYDQTAGRGVDKIEDLQVVVFVGMASHRAAVKNITPFVAGSGTKSIKAKLDETTGGAYASCSTVTVSEAELDMAKLGGVDLLAAIFHLNIFGPGA